MKKKRKKKIEPNSWPRGRIWANSSAEDFWRLHYLNHYEIFDVYWRLYDQNYNWGHAWAGLKKHPRKNISTNLNILVSPLHKGLKNTLWKFEAKRTSGYFCIPRRNQYLLFCGKSQKVYARHFIFEIHGFTKESSWNKFKINL